MATISGRSYVKAQSDWWADFSLTITESSTSVANNTSTMNYSFTAKQRPKSEFLFQGTTRNPAGKIVVKINGVDVKSANIAFSTNGGSCSGSGTVTVPHNSDGSKTLNYSIRMVEVTGNYSGDTWKYGAKTVSGSMTLTNIARASSISVSSGSGTKPGNGSIGLTISRASSSFTHTVTWSCAGLSGTVGSSLTTSASWSVPLSIIEKSPNANSTVTFTCKTYNGSTLIGSKTCTTTVGYHTASSISSSTSSIICNGTNSITVNITRNNSSFLHTVKFTFGSYTHSKSSQGVSSSYTPPTSWLNAITTATSGTGTITVSTFYNKTKIGSDVTAKFTMSVPDYTPSLTSVSVSKLQPGTISSWNVFIQNVSNVKFTFNGASSSYGATIKQYSVNLGGVNLVSNSATVSSEQLPDAGTINYTATITDSRNKTKSLTGSISVLKLTPPKLTSSDISRYNGSAKDDDGEQLYFKVSFSFESYSGLNKTTNEIYIKQSTSSTYIKYGTFTSGTALIISDYKFEMSKAYDINIIVTDTVGSKLDYTFTVSTSYAIIDISNSGKGIGLLCMSSREGYVEIGGTIESKGSLHTLSNVLCDGYIQPLQGQYIHQATGTSGSTGYVNVATINIKGVYANEPIKILYSRRSDKAISEINISFQNVNSTDPTLYTFTVDAPKSVVDVYMVKSATSTWKLYIEKTEGYDYITILGYYISSRMRDLITMTWSNEHAASLPSGYTSANKVDKYFNSVVIGAKKYSGNDGIDGVVVGSRGVIELTGYTPYIDFHSNYSTADFTSRIIDTRTFLQFTGKPTLVDGLVIPNEGDTSDNGTGNNRICGLTTSGNVWQIASISSGNNVVLGYGSYKNSAGATNVYGNEIYLYSRTGRWRFKNNISLFDVPYSTETGITITWADNTDHYIISRATNGLTSYFGWAGTSNYGTVSNIRGRQVTFNVAGTTYYANKISSSDRNLKYNIEYLSDDRYDEFFDNLKPSSYKMYLPEDGERTRIGITGQEVEEAMNKANLGYNDFYGITIENLKDMVEETNEKKYLLEKGLDKYYFVNYSEFIMLNLSQIQKLKKRVTELEKLLGGNQ